MSSSQDGGCCGGSGNNPNCCMNQMKDQTVMGVGRPSASGSLAVGQSRVSGSCYTLSTSLAVTLEEGTMRGHGAQMLKVPWYSLLLGSLARPPCSFFLERLPSSGNKLTWRKSQVNASEHLTLAILFPCRLLPQHLYSNQRISSP